MVLEIGVAVTVVELWFMIFFSFLFYLFFFKWKPNFLNKELHCFPNLYPDTFLISKRSRVHFLHIARMHLALCV